MTKESLKRKLVAAVAAWAVFVASPNAVDWTALEGTARGFPVLRDLGGKKLANGDFERSGDAAGLGTKPTTSALQRFRLLMGALPTSPSGLELRSIR